ncbi:MAG: hypothetical protein QF570_03180 [Myxococcota bacterium]|nr:hypothetical protein [Myxococcota bacterium]
MPVAGTPDALGFEPALGACGLNVAGVLRVDTYDSLVPDAWQSGALLPGAASAYVIGSGGSAFYEHARGERPDSPHPLDEVCEARVTTVVAQLRERDVESRALFYWERRGAGEGEFADFVAIAHAAGLGVRSRIGVLLHREHGPWFAIRAVLLTDRAAPAGSEAPPTPDFCSDCAAPCVVACPAGAVGEVGIDIARCSDWRHREAQCASRCDARLACPIGTASRYSSEALAHHMTAHFRGS